MLGLGTIGQFAIGQVDVGTTETITVDKWFMELSLPVRTAKPWKAATQAAFFMQPTPVVPFSWFAALTEPARSPPRSPAALARDFAMQMMPSPFVATGWFSPLSEPVRTRPGLKTAEYPFLAYQGDAITLTPFAWFMGLNTPVRFRSGLAAARQQFLASPSRLLPTPTTIGTLNARESGDLFTGGGRVWNRVVSGEVGAIERSFTGAEIGAVVSAPSAGTSGVVSDVSVPTSGSPVPAITTAKVSIIIV